MITAVAEPGWIDWPQVLLGKIYKERPPAGEKWRWFLNSAFDRIPAGVQASGTADTLDDAKAAIAEQYRKVRRQG